ncbi:ribonuclease H-like domain-containing protein, partial [Tanacetum coccineum]
MPHPTTPPTSPPQPNTPPSHSSTPISPQPDTHPSHSLTPIPTSAQTQSHAQTVDSHTLIPINNLSQTMPTHRMVTRAKAGIFKPLERMNCHVTTTSPLPRSHVHALRDPNWKEAMLDEYNALITNGTWVLVPRPTNVNVVRSMWLFKHKFNADGSLNRYKARLVANGRSQQQGIDCDKTFSLVVKPATIRTVLSLAVSHDWPIHQLDVKNAFLHGHLSETVYMHQLLGFVDPNKPDYVCHLQRSLYGLKQAPRACIIFSISIADHCFPPQTPVDTESKLGLDGDPICLYMHDPHDPHFTALKRILRYVCGTIDHGLQLHVSSTSQLIAYTYVDWVGCRVTRSAEAEYRGVANVVAETVWIRNLLLELHAPLCTATLVYCDNVSVVYLYTNPVQHQRTKHIEIDIHFVREYVASVQVRVLHVPFSFSNSIHKFERVTYNMKLYRVWIQHLKDVSKEKLLDHVGVSSWFHQICSAQLDFVAKERIVWIDIEGVPLHAWSRATFTKICSRWGEVMELEENKVDFFARKRICIKTKTEDNILEKFKVVLRGTVFVIRVKELFVWSPVFKEVDDEGYCSDVESSKEGESVKGEPRQFGKQDNDSDEEEVVSKTCFGDET